MGATKAFNAITIRPGKLETPDHIHQREGFSLFPVTPWSPH